MSTPLVSVFSRVAAKDCELGGYVVPKGTPVTVDLDSVHHNPHVWKDPKRFDPERFRSGGEADQIDSLSWMPFGGGGRQCIGLNFSLNEQRVVLSMLLKESAGIRCAADTWSYKKVFVVRKNTWSLPDDSIHKNGLVTTSTLLISPIDLRIKFKRRY